MGRLLVIDAAAFSGVAKGVGAFVDTIRGVTYVASVPAVVKGRETVERFHFVHSPAR